MIAVIGSGGLLGSMITRVFRDAGDRVLPFDLPDFDIVSRSQVLATFDDIKPTVIVNAAGIGDMDWLESRPNTAKSVHVHGTVNLREAAERHKAVFVQISCMECEHGESVFAESKRSAEAEAAEYERHLIVRVSTLFGPMAERSGGHLVETILNAVRHSRKFSAINDLWCSPTYTTHVTNALRTLVRQACSQQVPFGRYPLANAGKATPAEIVRELAVQIGLPLQIESVSHAEFAFLASRSVDTSICNDKTGKTGSLEGDNVDPIPILPPWQDALRDYLDFRQR